MNVPLGVPIMRMGGSGAGTMHLASAPGNDTRHMLKLYGRVVNSKGPNHLIDPLQNAIAG